MRAVTKGTGHPASQSWMVPILTICFQGHHANFGKDKIKKTDKGRAKKNKESHSEWSTETNTPTSGSFANVEDSDDNMRDSGISQMDIGRYQNSRNGRDDGMALNAKQYELRIKGMEQETGISHVSTPELNPDRCQLRIYV